MKKITVVGHLDWRGNDMIGAVVKARNIYEQLIAEFGDSQLDNVDIYHWKKKKVCTLCSIFNAFAKSSDIVLVCSDTSKILMKFFSILKRIFLNKIHYCVVGGDIAEILGQAPERIPTLACIDNFFVETEDCVTGLNAIGIKNVFLLRNFKCIDTVKQIEPYENKEMRFCTFSRVTKQKGIGDAIEAIEKLNCKMEDKPCELDIYGAIDPEYQAEFDEILRTHRHSHYCGVVDSKDSVGVLKKYYCLLFPTLFQTEGIPGTIIDGFAAALPVICSDWVRCRQIVTDGVDGIVYPFGDAKALENSVKYAVQNPSYVEQLKHGALKSFQKYKPDVAIRPLVDAIGREKKAV